MLGKVTQQGGAYVIAAGGAVLFEHRDANPMDHADINILLSKASLPSFPFSEEPCKTAPPGEVCGS